VLARELGMTVGEMMQRMSHTEFSYWCAVHSIAPIGDVRADLRAGIVAAEVHNGNVSKKKDLKQPTDYMPFYKKPEEAEFDSKAFFKNLNKFAVRKP
jgi:hypothetical protein